MGFAILYLVVKAAVRDGILEACRQTGEESLPAEKKGEEGENPSGAND